MAIEGAGHIQNLLFQMRDKYAADSNIGAERAGQWCGELMLYLHENGILVVPDAPEITAMKMPGDSWRAFHVFVTWLMAKRGDCTFEQAFEVLLKQRPKPRDIFLMIAIANAFGKSERWLNATEEMLLQMRKISNRPRGTGKKVTPKAVAAYLKKRGYPGKVKYEKVVATAAKYFKTSESTIARRLAEANKNNLMS
jgi:hypothetical protein